MTVSQSHLPGHVFIDVETRHCGGDEGSRVKAGIRTPPGQLPTIRSGAALALKGHDSEAQGAALRN